MHSYSPDFGFDIFACFYNTVLECKYNKNICTFVVTGTGKICREGINAVI